MLSSSYCKERTERTASFVLQTTCLVIALLSCYNSRSTVGAFSTHSVRWTAPSKIDPCLKLGQPWPHTTTDAHVFSQRQQQPQRLVPLQLCPSPTTTATTRYALTTASTQLYSWKGREIPPNPNKPVIPRKPRATAVYALILCHLAVFLADHVFHLPLIKRNLYLFHHRWKWWQPLTTCFCHANRQHLSTNLFLLLLFGRSVEDDLGHSGLLWSYAFCGAMASFASLWLLPTATVSMGASGAVFGLFAVSTLTKLSWNQLLDWRKVVEVAVLGEFVVRQLTSEVSVAARGGRAGVNHVAHLSGAVAGIIMVLGMRSVVARYEKPKT